jgi:tetratricopeptide (TPR) repeat protein
LFAVALAAIVVAAPAPGLADWQVHRTDSSALLERAERALLESPDNDQLARRVIQIAGGKGRAGVRERFKGRAQRALQAGGPGAYAPLAAYARLLLATGDGKAAAAAFSDVLRVAPQSPAALAGRAQALAVAGDEAAALAAYDEALQKEQRPAARQRLIEAELAIVARAAKPDDRATLEKAVALRRELARLDPDKDDAATRLADALEHAGRPAEGADVLEARLKPARFAVKFDLAMRAARLRLAAGGPQGLARAADALAALTRELPARDSDRRRAVWALAFTVARSRGMLAELARELERAPGPVEWDILGQVRDAQGDLEGALAATRSALAEAPRDGEIGRRLIALCDRLGRDQEATATYEELTRRIAGDPQFPVELIDRQIRRGQRAEAGAVFDRAIARFARDRGGLLALATVASRWGEDQRALKAWQLLRKLDPASEVVIVGLGESQFQLGKRDDAKRTWAALRDRVRPPSAGHLRLAEVLLEHDMTGDAATEAKRAQALDPKGLDPHRLLAQIFERQRKINEAVAEWNQVLALAARDKRTGQSPHGAARREARVRLLALLARQGRGRLDAQIRQLRDEVRAQPDDFETTLFLAEAQQRNGDAQAAVTTLRQLLTRLGERKQEAAIRDVTIEATFALVHLLKRTGQLDEAVTRLADITRLAPARARDANLQIAEIALASSDAPRALEHAAAAVPGADASTLQRIGDIQARAGADALATATYRDAVAHGAGPTAALALVRLLLRAGDEQEAAGVLDGLLRSSRDDEAIMEAGRLALDLGEIQGRLPDLQQRLAEAVAAGQDTPARRRTLVAVLRRMLPSLYREPASDEARLAIGRNVLRTLLEIITDGEQTPDRNAIELIGMLGNGDAAPALARIATRDRETAGMVRSGARPTLLGVNADLQVTAVVALARLADPRGRLALQRWASSADVRMRAAALWGLGRLDDARAVPDLIKALDDRQPDVVIAACFGLGRQPSTSAADALLAVAADARRPSSVRRAAMVALGRVATRPGPERQTVIPTLLDLLDAGDAELARAAAQSLAWSREPAALAALLSRALLPRRFALPDASAPLQALAAWQSSASVPDEARLLVGARIDVDAVLAGSPTSAVDVSPLWRTHTRDLQELLSDALARGGDARREALAALDGRADGLSLGPLTPEAAASLAPETVAATREVVAPLADRLGSLLDDADPDTRAGALRVLVKLGDDRVTPARIAAAASDGSPALAGAAVFAAVRSARTRPASATAIVAALAPALADESWHRRLAAVETLSALGPPGLAALERARSDRHAVVRAAVLAALAGH